MRLLGRLLDLAACALLFLAPCIEIGCNRSRDDDLDPKLRTEGVTRTDTELLAKFIRLPKQPSRVHWQTVDHWNHDNWALMALLEFTREDLAQILQNARKLPGQISMPRDQLEWLPAELRGRYASTAAADSGLIAVEGARFEATAFIDERSPLIQGYVGTLEPPGMAYLLLYTF